MIIITTELLNEFRQINVVLDKCCRIALRQPLPDNYLFFLTGASFQAAGSVVLTEDDLYQKFMSRRKTYALLAYGSRIFPPSQIKMSIYAKKTFSKILGFQRSWTNFLGINET